MTYCKINHSFFYDNNKQKKYFFSDKVDDTDAILIHAFFGDLVATNFRNDLTQNWLGFLGNLASSSSL